MDPVKIIIFVAAFLLLLLLGKKLSSGGDSYAATLPPGSFHPERAGAEEQDESSNQPTVVGADLPFPVHLPEIACDADGKYNRPEFLNYYFDHIDLRSGPENPESFCDHLYLQIRDVESDRPMYYEYLVATPAGLQKLMTQEHKPSLFLEGQAVIVPRWDLSLILDTAVTQIMKAYAEREDKETHALPNDDAV